MNGQTWWYLSRATGIVATVLAVAALVWGFFFSSRNTGERRRPAWWLDLHNWLGGTALAVTGAHLLSVYLDDAGYGVVELFVPGTVSNAITWGVIATYLLAITVFTSWPRKRFAPRVWRAVHLSSVVAVALIGVHGYQAGSDANTALLSVVLIVCAAVAVYATSLRLFSLRRSTNSQLAHSENQSASNTHLVESNHDQHDDSRPNDPDR